MRDCKRKMAHKHMHSFARKITAPQRKKHCYNFQNPTQKILIDVACFAKGTLAQIRTGFHLTE